jgi:hypothetical protein
MSKEKQEEDNLRDQIEREAKLLAEQEEINVPAAVAAQVTPITSLGKADKFKYVEEDDSIMGELGWKNVPIEYLPSQGLYYSPETQVAIRAATVSEIRHWSTIDDADMLGVDDMLNFIIEKCCRIKVPGKPGTYKDLKEIDRFYLIFAIRDYTFKNGENKMYVSVTTDEGFDDKVEVNKDIIDYFNPEERLMKYFNREEGCFTMNLKNGESFNIYFPSLGTMIFIKNFIKTRQQTGQKFDKAFVKYAPFIFNDWRVLTQASYDKAVQDSYSWSLQKISVFDKIVEMLSASINPQIRYVSSSGGEATAPLNFRDGIKSLFLISDIFGELV